MRIPIPGPSFDQMISGFPAFARLRVHLIPVLALLTAAEDKEIEEAIGFRHVMDLLSECKKPLVGHNMLLDLVQVRLLLLSRPHHRTTHNRSVHTHFPALVFSLCLHPDNLFFTWPLEGTDNAPCHVCIKLL